MATANTEGPFHRIADVPYQDLIPFICSIANPAPTSKNGGTGKFVQQAPGKSWYTGHNVS
jgi:hypothetical protein